MSSDTVFTVLIVAFMAVIGSVVLYRTIKLGIAGALVGHRVEATGEGEVVCEHRRIKYVVRLIKLEGQTSGGDDLFGLEITYRAAGSYSWDVIHISRNELLRLRDLILEFTQDGTVTREG